MKRLGQGPIERDVRELRVRLGQCGLAQPSGWLPFATKTVSAGISADGTAFGATIPRALTIRTWHQAANVLTTNDGSNYWLIYLRENDTTVITSVNTSAMSPGTWGLLSDTAIGYDVTTSDIGLIVTVSKVGSPGNLYLHAPAVFVT